MMDTQTTRRNFLKGAFSVAGATALATQAAGMIKYAGAEEAAEEQIEVAETVDCDVVIVGAGMAGLCAAIAGAEAGLNTVLLEKLGILGGTSITAEGMFGAHSKLQQEMGYADDTDMYFTEIENFDHWTNNPRICRRWLEYSSDTVDWVMDHGVTFRTILSSWSIVPTWHVYETRGGHTQQLAASAEAAGAHIYTETPAKQLLMNEDGSVAGVIAVGKDGKGIQFNAKGVIMCSGGYPCNREMINTYSGWNFISEEEEDLETGFTSWKGTPGRDGDGILMGMAAGADTFRLGAVMADYTEIAGRRVEEAHPSRCLVGIVPTVWVNQDAKRFASEGLVDSFVAHGECHAGQPVTYNILDHDFLLKQCEGICCDTSGETPAGTPFPDGEALIDEYVAGDDFAIWKADTIEELAEQMGLDPVALRDTIDHYNEMCDNGKDDDFLKDPKYLIPVRTAPFYGVKNTPIFMTTVGGLRVDERMRVLKEDGKPIRGLYACGSDAGGLYGYEYDVLVAAGSQQSFAAVGGRLSIADFKQCVLEGADGYVPAGHDLFMEE